MTRVEMRAERAGQVAARRETDHADLVRIDAPLGRPRTDRADRPLPVHHRHRMLVP